MSDSWMSRQGLALSGLDPATICKCGHMLDEHLLETENVRCDDCGCDGFVEVG